jgi:ribonuclease HI
MRSVASTLTGKEKMTESFKGIVIFTDGSARPTSRGKTGWGVHGYHYTTEESKRGTGLARYHVTNKGYIPESAKSSIVNDVFKVTPIEYYDFFGNSLEIGTNNAAEVDALYNALEKFKDHDIKCIQVYTDSEYMRRGVSEWARVWRRNNWVRNDGTEVPNRFNWVRLLDVLDHFESRGIPIVVDWVKGHSDNFGNIRADILATLAVVYALNERYKVSFDTRESAGYWKSDVVKHPFFGFKVMYFNSTSENNIVGSYYMADPAGEDYIIGRRLPDAAYSVVRLKEYDPAIEIIRKHQCSVTSDINAVMTLRLDRLFQPDVYPFIAEHRENAIVYGSKNTFGLNFLDDKPLTLEINPSGLSLRAVENFSLLDEVLDRVIAFNKGEAATADAVVTSTQVHDITSSFYDIVEKTKKNVTSCEYQLKSIFAAGPETTRLLNVGVTLDINNVPCDIGVSLVLGADVVSRNQLKHLEKLQPKIQLVTWRESEKAVRYATVIEVDSGYGIWSNYFADRVFLK